MSTSNYSIDSDKKIAIICNSSNIDFFKYFSSLVKHLDITQVVFFANKSIALKINSDKNFVSTSSFVKNSFLDKYSIIDFSISFFVILKLKLRKVKLVHFITAHLSNIPQAFFARLFGIKVAFTIHDLEPHPDKKSFFVNMYNKLVTQTLGNFIIVHNKKYEQSLDRKNVFFIPLSGFEMEFIERVFNKRLLFFGRIEEYKGVENLYMLGKEFLKEGLDFEILITGKGSIPKSKNLIPPNIKIINRFIPEEELKELQRSIAFTILPYNSASQSGVIIQSYAYGTPVIAYNVGSLPEYVVQNKTGIIVKHNDFQSIINFLTKIDNKQYEEMQKEVQAIFENQYDSRSFARYSAELYRTLLKNKR